ncbi:hypothetical protein DW070_02845 [Coprococcus catus]|uniref:Uncharacterized protein n=1 Tax=Coprococcus catus TaxID=116085 RepID=A0A3E2TS34_9FIRM|nr:hypothetical protein DW070_02845 [Coprococcus catus]
MNAKFIYNSIHPVWAGTLLKMADLAVNAGYEFFLFNDRIYHVTADKKGTYIAETKLSRSDIFMYL